MKRDKPRLVHFIKTRRCEALRVRVEKIIEIYPCDVPACFQGPYRDVLKFVLELNDDYEGCLREGLDRLVNYLDAIMDGYKEFSDGNYMLYKDAPGWLTAFDDDLPTDETIALNSDLEELLEDVNEMFGYLKTGSWRWTKVSIFDELLRGHGLSGVIEARRLAKNFLAKKEKTA